MIKINSENENAIEQALRAVNGKSSSHTYIYYADIFHCAADAEKALENLGIPKALRRGATYTVQSGSNLPGAYKYEARTTTVTIERRGSGWVLTKIEESKLYPRSNPKKYLRLTAEQDSAAVAHTRKNYSILAA